MVQAEHVSHEFVLNVSAVADDPVMLCVLLLYACALGEMPLLEPPPLGGMYCATPQPTVMRRTRSAFRMPAIVLHCTQK